MSRPLQGLLCTAFLCVFSISLSAQDNLWSDVDNGIRQNITATRTSQKLPASFRLVKLNGALAKQFQSMAPVETATNRSRMAVSAVPFNIPLPDGTQLGSSFFESPILSRELQRQLAHVKTYELVSRTKSSLGRITITPDGITGLIFTDKGSVYISPVGKAYPDVHMVYEVKDLKADLPVLCGVKDELKDKADVRTSRVAFGDCQLRTYRLAVSATGEYTANWAGNQTNALAYITITVNNVNAIYQKELAIRFTLVSTNAIIYPDPTLDPFTPGTSISTQTLNDNNAAVTGALGAGAFDISILFHFGWNGGRANLVSVCTTNKGRSAAGLDFGTGANPADGPQGPIFDVTVAHEIAHQFGATHTFMATNGGCLGNPTPATAMEPGGGSTIMAYAGVCAPNSYQQQSDHYFHGVSLFQITDFAVNSTPCAAVTSSGNTAPDVTIPAVTYTIPVSTSFTLTSTATDADGNTLTYNWEQTDAGTPGTAAPASSNTTGPNFRSYPPSTNPSRTFPRLTDLVSGAPTPYEVLPSVSRAMNFAVTVRDNVAGAGCTDFEELVVNTDAAAGPFIVTSQNTPTNWTANGTNTATINWNVANTNAAPINCAAVDILFSVDGGYTYPYTLAAATANDGTHAITIPNLPTLAGRLKVQAVGNIWFDINAGNITITSACDANGVTVTPATPVSANAGNAALDLSLSPAFGSPVVITGTLTSTDTHGWGAWNYNAVGSCIESGGDYRHDVFSFTVSVAGSYTFSRAGGVPNTVMFNLYRNSFNPNQPCSELIASSITYDDDPGPPSVFASNVTATLTPGVIYTLAVGTYSNTQPALPQNYTINVTPPVGGAIVTGAVNPGAGFNYTYVIVNNTTGNIIAIDAGADLTAFAAGNYTVYGLSYSNAIAPATLNAYVGGPFSTLQNDALYAPGTFCSQLSANSVAVEITGSLPAEMLPLKASKLNNTVSLKWGTLHEQNTSHFEVLRSLDGVHFETSIGRVTAAGNSNSLINYSFVDQAPGYGINYYRLKQVDLDNKATLSNIAHIDMTQALTLATVYPSPAKAILTLEYITEKAGPLQVMILDNKGAVVKRMQINTQEGKNIKTLNVAGLAKGIYAIQITGSDGVTIKRFVKE